ncbi:MAG: YeeE/YedE family protein [Pseudomonadota bacterium]|nr:YeeE/YedE family protein [Pseudomonadota bacterium]
MNLDWNHFTPWSALAGGVLVGLATALYLLGDGRIAGIAGIVSAPLRAVLAGSSLAAERVRLMFIGGLLLAPWAWRLFAPLPPATVDVGPGALVVAGLLVGVGVRMGNGCTSGHGVCGLSRFSLRSLVNVVAFMGAGVVTVFILRHLL